MGVFLYSKVIKENLREIRLGEYFYITRSLRKLERDVFEEALENKSYSHLRETNCTPEL